MTETQHVWLTKDAHQRLSEELAELLGQRTEAAAVGSPTSGGGHARSADDVQPATGRRDREQRIRKLHHVLAKAKVDLPPDDGIAEPGMVLTVRFSAVTDTETLLLAERELNFSPDIEVCSPDSPLGRALCWAKEGERRECRLPNGEKVTVTLVGAVPYESWSA